MEPGNSVRWIAGPPAWGLSKVAAVEAEIAELEDTLGQPTTWREPLKAIKTQDRHKVLTEQLPKLYEAWEEALELNG